MIEFSLDTPRLLLEWLSRPVADAILRGDVQSDWGPGFPAAGERRAAQWVTEDVHGGVGNAPFLPYTVREKLSGLLIGGAGFHGRPKDRSVELGYGLSARYWGRGFATEACRTLVAAALASGAVDVVVATTDVDNVSSQSVLRRVGFQPTNAERTRWIIDDVAKMVPTDSADPDEAPEQREP